MNTQNTTNEASDKLKMSQQYAVELENKITELVNWCIDKRGWSRLSCAGEIAAATRKHYDEMSKRVSFV